MAHPLLYASLLYDLVKNLAKMFASMRTQKMSEREQSRPQDQLSMWLITRNKVCCNTKKWIEVRVWPCICGEWCAAESFLWNVLWLVAVLEHWARSAYLHFLIEMLSLLFPGSNNALCEVGTSRDLIVSDETLSKVQKKLAKVRILDHIDRL